MFGTRKRKIQVWSVIISLTTLYACNSDKEKGSVTLTGNTQGTTYTIIIVEDDVSVGVKEIDSILSNFDQSLSTYLPSSVISKINASPDSISINDPSEYFTNCYLKAQQVYLESDGAFDPSVFPLVEGWGFMKHIETPLDSATVDSLLTFVSFQSGMFHDAELGENIKIYKKKEGFKIDFNAIAQGYSVDVLADYLIREGYSNFYIEIGGELFVKGLNREGNPWRIGIDSPIENQVNRDLENIINVSDKAVATSGNYRNFYEKDGVKYAHTLNPKTGWPVQHQLLSVTVITDECSMADAYATAFMVMGVEKTIEFVSEINKDLEVYMIYTNEKGELERQTSSGFEKYLN